MKKIVSEISQGDLELELVNEHGLAIPNFPKTKNEDYIHTIYNLKYKNDNLGVLSITNNNIKNTDSLIAGLEHLVNNNVKILKIFEYDQPTYSFTKIEYKNFPIIGYVEGKRI